MFTIDQLRILFHINHLLGDHNSYAVAFALLLFAFLHISNLAPTSIHSFQRDKHLVRGDIMFTHDNAVVMIKWANNLQSADQYHEVRVPYIPSAPFLSPVTNLKLLLMKEPGIPSSP